MERTWELRTGLGIALSGGDSGIALSGADLRIALSEADSETLLSGTTQGLELPMDWAQGLDQKLGLHGEVIGGFFIATRAGIIEGFTVVGNQIHT